MERLGEVSFGHFHEKHPLFLLCGKKNVILQQGEGADYHITGEDMKDAVTTRNSSTTSP